MPFYPYIHLNYMQIKINHISCLFRILIKYICVFGEQNGIEAVGGDMVEPRERDLIGKNREKFK